MSAECNCRLDIHSVCESHNAQCVDWGWIGTKICWSCTWTLSLPIALHNGPEKSSDVVKTPDQQDQDQDQESKIESWDQDLSLENYIRVPSEHNRHTTVTTVTVIVHLYYKVYV